MEFGVAGGVAGGDQREVHPVGVVHDEALEIGRGGEGFARVFWVREGGFCYGGGFEEAVSACGDWS